MVIQLADKFWFKKRFMIVDHKTDFVTDIVFPDMNFFPKVRCMLVPPEQINSDFVIIILEVKNKDLPVFNAAMEKVERRLQFYRGYGDFVDSIKTTLEPYRLR